MNALPDPFKKQQKMKTKKLRIGNWVNCNGSTVKVCELNSIGEILVQHTDTWQSGQNACGIALSPEILDKHDFWNSDNVWSWNNDERTQSVDIYWHYDIAHVEIQNGFETRIESNITDVHELQNLLIDADIDLEINL